MKRNRGIKAPTQVGIEDFKGIFRGQIRTMVRHGLLGLWRRRSRIGVVRVTICRWHDETNQVARWMAVALLRAQSGFRRISGHQQLGELAAALARP